MWWLALIVGQIPVLLARKSIERLIRTVGGGLVGACRASALVCRRTAGSVVARNRDILLTEDELRRSHNLRRSYGRLRDAHLKERALLPDYYKHVDTTILQLDEDKTVPKTALVRLRDLTERLVKGAQTLLEQGGRFDAQLKKAALDEEKTENILVASVYRTAIVSGLTMLIAAAAAFVNYNLIALPMGELVPSDEMVMGLPVAKISALVIVLLELVVGIFLLEAMGITRLFDFDNLARWHVRVIGVVAFLGLLFLAGVEATLAIMREEIVAGEAALKAELAGQAIKDHSTLPMIGQAALGFVLPWIIAMVGIPLEQMVESSRQILGRGFVVFLRISDIGFRSAAWVARRGTDVALSLLDVYVAIPRMLFDLLGKK